MTRTEVLVKLALRLRDTYKIYTETYDEFYALRIRFAINANYAMDIEPFYRWYGAELDNFNECDVDYLYNKCCQQIEHAWLNFLRSDFK